MLLVLSEEHKEHLSFLTKVDVEGKVIKWRLNSILAPVLQWCGSSAEYLLNSSGKALTKECTNLQLVSGHPITFMLPSISKHHCAIPCRETQC